MNKYFLSLMSILILFQSFRVLDEIFYNDKDNFQKKTVNLKTKIEEQNTPEESNQIITDIDTLFKFSDIAKGTKIAKQCSSCHDFSNKLKIKLGPPLWGVVGRQSGIIADFKYSDALLNFKKEWSRIELFNFLEEPKKYVKGTKMIYNGIKKPVDRVNLITYLESLK